MTLGRATLVVGVAALTADSFERDVPVAMLVALATVALVLDYVDGWVARRTASESALGARLDGEVDAFLILVLSVYVASSAGPWVLAIGAARYVFLAAGWPFAWMRAPLPRRDWRKVVAATQGITLTVAAAGVVPPTLMGRPSPSRSPCFPSRSAAMSGGSGGTGMPPSEASRRIAGHGPQAAVPHRPRPSRRLGRSRRTQPAEPAHARGVRAAPDRGHRRRRAGPRRCPAPAAASWRGSSGRRSACWSS